MKKSILILCAAFALVGCSQQGGGTSTGEQSTTGSSTNNVPSSNTSTNELNPVPNQTSQGAATSPGDTNNGSSATGTPKQ